MWFYAYLAIVDDWVSRHELANLFRPDATEAVAKHYVRNLINRARTLPCGHLLEARHDQCRLRVDTDVARFHESMARGWWEEAVTLHQGPLLQGVEIRNAPRFETWLEQKRCELDLAWNRACMQHVAELEAYEFHTEAMEVLERLLHRDQLNEQALQAFLRNALLAGQRARALEVAWHFQEELHTEFGIEPTEATLALVAQLRHSETLARPFIGESPRHRWSDRVAGSVGETHEIASLLKHPSRRLLAVLETDPFAAPMLLVAHRARDEDSALCAIMDLVEAMLAKRHYRRATELVSLVASKRPLNAYLTPRFESAINQLARHVPKHHVSALMDD